MLARYMLSSCVRPSVCHSTSRRCIETAGRIELLQLVSVYTQLNRRRIAEAVEFNGR